jgi:hypothetical protein
MQKSFKDVVQNVCLSSTQQTVDVTVTLTLDATGFTVSDKGILLAPFQTDGNWSEWYVMGPTDRPSDQTPDRVIRVRRTWSFNPT